MNQAHHPDHHSQPAADPLAQHTHYFRVNRRDLVFLKFILEAYEGMSTLSTVEKETAIVSLTVPAGFSADLAGLIAALGREIVLEETLPPLLSCS